MSENRKLAFSNVKSAVRSYAKEPTAQHAAQVEEAWGVIRRIDSLSHWREWQEARLNVRNALGRSGQAQ